TLFPYTTLFRSHGDRFSLRQSTLGGGVRGERRQRTGAAVAGGNDEPRESQGMDRHLARTRRRRHGDRLSREGRGAVPVGHGPDRLERDEAERQVSRQLPRIRRASTRAPARATFTLMSCR